MAFEIINKEIEVAVEKISAQVKRHKNGVVADSLKKSGILYEMSYGVSIVHLRMIAETYPPNNTLAKALWRKKWRETMMLATLLLEKKAGSVDLLLEFTNDADTEEMYQQIGMNALAMFPDTKSLIISFLQSENHQQKNVAYSAIARLYTGKDIILKDADYYTSLLLKAVNETEKDWLEINALAKALSKVGYVSSVDNAHLLESLAKKKSSAKAWEVAYELVKTEFEYR